MKLIEEWRRAHRYWSVRLSAVGAAIMGAWTALPPDLRAQLPYAQHLAAGLFLAIAASRLVDQGSQKDGERTDG